MRAARTSAARRASASIPARSRGSASWLGPEGRYCLLASAPFVVAFGIVPFSLYAHSGEEWAFAPELLLRLAGLGLVAFVATVILLRRSRCAPSRRREALAIGLFCLGAFICLPTCTLP